MPPMGPSKGKVLIIDIVSQNRLNATKIHVIWHKIIKIGSGAQGVTPRGLSSKTKFLILLSPYVINLHMI